MNESVLTRVKYVHHFYWCLSVFLLMQKQNPHLSGQEKISRVKQWLASSGENKKFREYAQGEIYWLKELVNGGKNAADLEKIIINITSTLSEKLST